MRKLTCFVLAAALASAPALAQNDADANAAVDANATMTMDANTVAANDLAAVPPPAATDMTTESAPAPAPARKSSGGFPWGVVGLVGLIGLMGRKRRD